MFGLRIYKVVSNIISNCLSIRALVDILFRALTENMGTMFECLHRALEDKNVGSVSADIGAEFCCVGLEHSTSRKAVQRPTT